MLQLGLQPVFSRPAIPVTSNGCQPLLQLLQLSSFVWFQVHALPTAPRVVPALSSKSEDKQEAVEKQKQDEFPIFR